MGLDVIVFTGLKEIVDKTECIDKELLQEENEIEYICDHISPFVVENEWSYKIKNVIGKHYSYKNRFRMISYSYSTHNNFREYLLHLIGREDLITEVNIKNRFTNINEKKISIDWDKLFLEKDLPFYDLIYFSDCEGYLDWEIADKLYEDFTKYSDGNNLNKNIFYKRYYDGWLETCLIASVSKGVIGFH